MNWRDTYGDWRILKCDERPLRTAGSAISKRTSWGIANQLLVHNPYK